MNEKKVCPECGHVFQGSGWDGIDAHWRSPRVGHEDVMPYEDAWPLLRDGRYPTGSLRGPQGSPAQSR